MNSLLNYSVHFQSLLNDIYINPIKYINSNILVKNINNIINKLHIKPDLLYEYYLLKLNLIVSIRYLIDYFIKIKVINCIDNKNNYFTFLTLDLISYLDMLCIEKKNNESKLTNIVEKPIELIKIKKLYLVIINIIDKDI